MAVSNHKVAASDGTTANPPQVEGGTFIDGGSASASAAVSNRLGLGLARDTGGNGPTENVHGVMSRRHGDSSWDYQAAGSYVVRRMATTLNGTACDALKSGGSMTIRRSIHVRSDQIGAKLVTAHRAGQWRPTGIAGQRTNWSVAPTSAAANYAANTGSASATSDDAARPSRAVPGELVYLHNHVLWTDNMINYAARE